MNTNTLDNNSTDDRTIVELLTTLNDPINELRLTQMSRSTMSQIIEKCLWDNREYGTVKFHIEKSWNDEDEMINLIITNGDDDKTALFTSHNIMINYVDEFLDAFINSDRETFHLTEIFEIMNALDKQMFDLIKSIQSSFIETNLSGIGYSTSL